MNKFHAQDVHWSQFYDNPVFLNPANSGNFNGTSRFNALYRDQWRSVSKPFQTFSFSYDTQVGEKKEFGLGILVFNDVVGDGKFKTLEVQLAPSYQKLLAEDSSKTLRFGLQLALNHRSFTFPNFYFDEQYNGVSYDPNLPITEDLVQDKKTNISIGSGVGYQHHFDSKKSIQIGVSAFNINRPNQGFYGEKVQRDIRLSIYSIVELKTSSKTALLPAFIFQKQGTYSEFIIGSRFKYILSDGIKNKKALFTGVFLRTGDALNLNLGLNYNTWYFSVNYDINFSSLVPASARRGGVEIAARYIINRFKPKKIQHRICPEFI